MSAATWWGRFRQHAQDGAHPLWENSTSARLATASVCSSPCWCPKHSRTMSRLNEQTFAMYGRGMTVREISAYLEELYGIDVSAEFISNATESVLEDVNEWQSRPP